MIKKMEFTLYAFTSGNRVYVELDQKILKVKWHGIVTEASVKDVSKHCNDLITSNLVEKIIIDRSELVMFTSDALNTLFLAFLLNKETRRSQSIKKIAVIASKELNTIEMECGMNGALVQGFPTADIQSFRSSGPASSWIIEQ